MLPITLHEVWGFLNQPFVMMIVEKLLIGAGFAAIFFFAQKRLEDHKAQQTLKSEIAEKRVERIASGWAAVNAWDSTVENLIRNFAILLREQQPELDLGAGLDNLGQPDLTKLAEIVGKLKGDQAAMHDLKEQCKSSPDLGELIAESKKESRKVNASMQENRFWFGKYLYDHCHKFQLTLHQICMAFDKWEFENLADLLQDLKARRGEVLTMLADLHWLSSASVAREKKLYEEKKGRNTHVATGVDPLGLL